MLRVDALEKSYPEPFRLFRGRKRVQALRDITFTVKRGEIIGLVGANGAGKSTALHLIAGITLPDAGAIELDGAPLSWQDARRHIGLCSSADRSFYYRLTLRENLAFFARLHNLHGDDLRARVDEELERHGLAPYADRRYALCSTGIRQRLSLARALLHDPLVVLLDEPTRAVDPLHAQNVRTFVRDELARERRKIVVLATNVIEEAWQICDRIVLINGGRGIAVDSPASLRERFTRSARYRLTVDALDQQFLRRLEALGTVSSKQLDSEQEITVDIGVGSEPLSRLLFEVLNSPAAVRAVSLDSPAASDLFQEFSR